MQTDTAIEAEIQAKGLTAPRLRPTDLDANIAHTEYVKHISMSGQVLRWAVLTTKNGFAVTGKPSASVSPANDDAEIGEKVAYDNARQELWPLMGYALKDQLFQATQPAQAPVESALPPHQQRVITEKAELDEKLSKLLAFFGSETYKAIPGQDQHLLQQQSVSMEHYSEILGMRIEGFGIQP